MINVFLAHSGKDKNIFDTILEYLKPLTNYCDFWYYQPVKVLTKVHIFTVFISHNSLSSTFVQEEISIAKELEEIGDIKLICPIIIDSSINPDSDKRIPEYIKKSICHATSPKMAAQIIEERTRRLKGK